jgi:hypothetical protein
MTNLKLCKLARVIRFGPFARLRYVEDQRLMKLTMLVVTLMAALLLTGCWQDHPRTIVVLIDATASIDPLEYERCRFQLNRVTQKLGRGDRLVLVPITGEPQELLGHRIVHVDMPSDRVPYDSNLKKARADAAKRIEEFLVALPAIQAKQTDIIGALRATADEFRPGASELLILSDMVEDDSEIRFPIAPELATAKSAETLAERMARRNMLRGVEVKIGILKSFDLERMPQQRKDAVQAFWQRYFATSGASKVTITVDLENLEVGNE